MLTQRGGELCGVEGGGEGPGACRDLQTSVGGRGLLSLLRTVGSS